MTNFSLSFFRLSVQYCWLCRNTKVCLKVCLKVGFILKTYTQDREIGQDSYQLHYSLGILICWSLLCNISILQDCRSDGIGRRASFRDQFPQGSGSSSLPYGTRTFLPNCRGRESVYTLKTSLQRARQLSWQSNGLKIRVSGVRASLCPLKNKGRGVETSEFDCTFISVCSVDSWVSERLLNPP